MESEKNSGESKESANVAKADDSDSDSEIFAWAALEVGVGRASIDDGEKTEFFQSSTDDDEDSMPDLQSMSESEWSDSEDDASDFGAACQSSLSDSDDEVDAMSVVSDTSSHDSFSDSEGSEKSALADAVPNVDLPCSFRDIAPRAIGAANKQSFFATGIGEMLITVSNGNEASKLKLIDVLYYRDLAFSLISIGRIDDSGCTALFGHGCCEIRGKMAT
ncbi:hypothetical protein DFH09DRAFT_1454444 [Mycena vulgaris]|nr:hypothetical protein DFH09DRAFT_1454444 [Mycena vulgaris]